MSCHGVSNRPHKGAADGCRNPKSFSREPCNQCDGYQIKQIGSNLISRQKVDGTHSCYENNPRYRPEELTSFLKTCDHIHRLVSLSSCGHLNCGNHSKRFGTPGVRKAVHQLLLIRSRIFFLEQGVPLPPYNKTANKENPQDNPDFITANIFNNYLHCLAE